MAITAAATIDNLDWAQITPDNNGDWINQRNPRFQKFRSLTRTGSDQNDSIPIFELSSQGIKTSRDAWVFNSSMPNQKDHIKRAAEFFNEQCAAFESRTSSELASQRLAAARAFVERDTTRFSWDRATERRLASGRSIAINPDGFRSAAYRPFFRQAAYMDRSLNAEVYRMPRVFPSALDRNVGIAVTRKAVGGSPGVLAIDALPAHDFGGIASWILPRYALATPESDGSQMQFLSGGPTLREGRRDNINARVLADYRAQYGSDITTDHVFSYVYGILHSPTYRARYQTGLSKTLPQVPDVASSALFRGFADSGQQLLDLHLGYETVQPYELNEQWQPGVERDNPATYRVTKMRFAGSRRNPDRSTLIYNHHITLRGIPEEAHAYVIGPRSALAWVMDRYQVKTHKPSGIVNDPNDWTTEHGQPRYILNLVKRIVTVSLETLRIVRNLPPLDEAPEQH